LEAPPAAPARGSRVRGSHAGALRGPGGSCREGSSRSVTRGRTRAPALRHAPRGGTARSSSQLLFPLVILFAKERAPRAGGAFAAHLSRVCGVRPPRAVARSGPWRDLAVVRVRLAAAGLGQAAADDVGGRDDRHVQPRLRSDELVGVSFGGSDRGRG